MSGSKSNVDLLLHEASTGPGTGFAESVAGSSWGLAQSDFVLVNQRAQTPRPYDVGVLRAAGGVDSYTVHSTSSSYLGSSPVGDFGPFTMPAQRIVALHEAWLDDGEWTLDLENLAGSVDWGISLHPPFVGDDTPFMGKSDTVVQGAAWIAPAGVGEAITFVVPPGGAGYHCIAVWKTTSAELPKSGDYRLRLHRNATDVADGLPRVPAERLVVSPNPFNPRTVVRFELAQQEHVRVEVLNGRGTRVRTLLAAELAPGRHMMTFDGVDDRGRALSSGLYFVRLQTAAGVRDVQKVVLLK
jgi:hypothetical protein